MNRWIAAAALLAVAGCGLTPPTARQVAEDAADSHADAVGDRISRWQINDHKAMQFARLALETPLDGDSVEVMRAEGDAWENNGVLVVRIVATGSANGYGGSPRGATVIACYRYAVTMYGDAEPEPVDCPAGKALAIPRRPPAPMLPPGSYDRAKAALTALSPAQRKDLAAVRRAVEKGITGHRGAHLETATAGSALGVSARAGDDCLLARVDGARVAVWAPPPSYLLPGEEGCHAAMAATGNTPDPH
jgi:hypothetical protein